MRGGVDGLEQKRPENNPRAVIYTCKYMLDVVLYASFSVTGFTM